MEVNFFTNQLAGWPSSNHVNYKIDFPVRLTGAFVLDIAHDGLRMLRLVGFISYFRDNFLDFANTHLMKHHGHPRPKGKNMLLGIIYFWKF